MEDMTKETSKQDMSVMNMTTNTTDAETVSLLSIPSSVAGRKEPLSDPTDSRNVSGAPRPKKGGFVITNVKDYIDDDDGLQSADDLDESHAYDESHSDLSYSITTNIDHDQESSASEDTLNITVQDSIQYGGIPTFTSSNSAAVTTDVLSSSKSGNRPIMTMQLNDHPDTNSDATPVMNTLSPVHQITVGSSAFSSTSTAAFSVNKEPVANEKVISTTSTISTVSSAPVVFASLSSTSSIATTTASASSITTKGANRSYKIVKRDTHILPTKRERSRWTCHDYMDSHAPNLSFVAHSSSDSRLNYPASDAGSQHTSGIPPSSIGSSTILSSSSSFNLKHSDSNSSLHRDGHTAMMNSAVSIPSNTVQHSASTSSVIYDIDGKKIPTAKSVSDASDDAKRRKSIDDRGEGSVDQDVLRNIIQTNADGTESEDENGSSRGVRIDNRIEAAMDLVKKHLMSAVNTEVDELKEVIKELKEDLRKMTSENEALRMFLTPEQLNAYQQQKMKEGGISLQKSASAQLHHYTSQVSQTGAASLSTYPMQNLSSTSDVLMTNPQQSQQPTQQLAPMQPINHQHPMPLTLSNHSIPMNNQAVVQGSLGGNVPLQQPQTQVNLPLQNSMSTIHQQQLIQQQILQQQQMQQAQPALTTQNIQPNAGNIYQISSQPQAQQLTPQQMQALRQQQQQQQVYQQQQQQLPVAQTASVPASYQPQPNTALPSATVFQPQVIQQNNQVVGGGQFQASVPFTGQHQQQQLSTTIYPTQQQQQQAALLQQQQRVSASMTMAMNAPQTGSVMITPSRSQTLVQATPSNPAVAAGIVHPLPQQAPNIGLTSVTNKITSPQQQVNPPTPTLPASQDPRFVTHT